MHIKYQAIIIAFLISCYSHAQVTTQISGYVKDETGMPLVGATVYLQNTDKGAITDVDGYYTIKQVQPGPYNLAVSYIGYQPQTKFNVLIKSVGNQLYNFALQQTAEALSELVVTPDKNTVSRPRETPLSTQTLTAAELATYPGGNNDVVRVAQSLPGVSPSVGGFRNDLIIRGGAPNESVYYLDGVEIPNINHFATQGSSGGPVGLLNVSFIDDVTLSTSAFGAQYDNPLSGVLQFKQIDGNKRDFNANFRLSASEAAVTLNGPLFKGKKEQSKTSYILSVRRSYLQFLFEVIGLPIRPDYYDYQYKVTHEIDAYNTLSLTGVGSVDDFAVAPPDEFEANAQSTVEQAPFIEQQTNAIGITWKKRFKNGKGFMSTTLSNNILLNDFSRFTDNENRTGLFFNNDARETETKLRYTFTQFVNKWKIVAGFNGQLSDYENSVVDFNNGFEFNTAIDFFKYGFFANATKTFLAGKLDASLGIRTDGDTFTESSSLIDNLSPRLALSYQLPYNWKINATAGRYFKIPIYTILGFQQGGEFVNRDARYTRSDHFVLGIEKIFGPASNLTLEGFLKNYEDYPVSVRDQVSLANQGADFVVLGNEAIETVGRGRSYGLELSYQQKLTNNFYGIFSYTFFFSEFTGFDREVFIPSVWDSRHLASFTGGYKLKKNWEISSRWRFAGRTPFVPADLEATLIRYPEIVPDYSRLGEESLNVFSQVDIRIDKKWNFEKLSFNIFFEVQNIFLQRIQEPPEFGLTRDAAGNIENPISLVELQPEDGTPIPTIGIVLDF